MDVSAQDLTHVAFLNLHQPGTSAFFSLHSASDTVLYVSEVVRVAAGAAFGVLSLPDLGPRTYKLAVKLWTLAGPAFALAYAMKLDLRNLRPVPCDLLDVPAAFGPRTVVWCFGSTYYCLPDDVDLAWHKSRTASWLRVRVKKHSYTLDDMRQMASLCKGIRDFELAKDKLSGEIDRMGAAASDPLQLKFDLHTLHKYVAKQQRANDALLSEVYAKQLHINRITQIVEEEFPSFQEICTERLEIVASETLPIYESLHAAVYPDLIDAVQKIAVVVQDVFPIELQPSGKLSILGIEVPSSTREILHACYYGDAEPAADAVADHINAALSYIVFLMSTLSVLMNVPLKYQMKYVGSASYIVDHLLPQQLTPVGKSAPLPTSLRIVYPLHYDDTHAEKIPCYDNPERKFDMRHPRFERGLQLLTKNLAMLIAGISERYALYYHDDKPNHTLSNNIPPETRDDLLWCLQYVLLFITAPADPR